MCTASAKDPPRGCFWGETMRIKRVLIESASAALAALVLFAGLPSVANANTGSSLPVTFAAFWLLGIVAVIVVIVLVAVGLRSTYRSARRQGDDSSESDDQKPGQWIFW